MSDKKPVSQVQRQVGERLRQARKRKGWSLHRVQDETGGAWPAVVVGSYERGDRAVSVVRLLALAELYGVPVVSLLPIATDDAQVRAVVYEEIADQFRDRAATCRGDRPQEG